MKKTINVTVWNEFRHEKKEGAHGDLIRSFYPNGIHRVIADGLASPELNIRCATLDEPEHGLPDEVLNTTDVLIWWGHMAHGDVSDALVDKVQKRILNGMGLVVLHSGHFSKIFRRMMGTTCSLQWREVGEKERLWVVEPSHPVAKGLPESFTLPNVEMYGERFDVPQDGKVVFLSWYEGGNVFRSGLAYERGHGKIFYFSPGHETYPIFHDANIQKVIANAVRWAAPEAYYTITCPKSEALEEIRTPDPNKH